VKRPRRVRLERTVRRQRLVRHLLACGPWPILEVLLAVANGDDLDETIEAIAKLQPESYRALHASELPLPVQQLTVIRGGK
jgi:hypothetical protein